MPELEIAHPDRGRCTHHWVLEDPVDGRIIGRCRSCRGTKTFPASLESVQRFDDYRELTAAASVYSQPLPAWPQSARP